VTAAEQRDQKELGQRFTAAEQRDQKELGQRLCDSHRAEIRRRSSDSGYVTAAEQRDQKLGQRLSDIRGADQRSAVEVLPIGDRSRAGRQRQN
jgi:hypothetical protein